MKRYLTAISALLFCTLSNAQNFNPKVEVTNDYETRMADIAKQSLSMNVPDSLLQFDYNFDYSVFDSPYKGAYEFSPYTVQMTPEASPYGGSRFWMKAGAGYALQPVLKAVWSPLPKADSRMSIYQDFDGYFGPYRRLDNGLKAIKGQYFDGYDFSEKLGVEGSKNFEKFILKGGLEYGGLYTWENLYDTMFHTGTAKVGVSSVVSEASKAFYDVDVMYRFGYDTSASLTENDVRVSGSAGPLLRKFYRVAVDFDFLYSGLTGGYERGLSHLNITPKAGISAGIIDFDLGLTVSSADSEVNLFPSIDASVALGNANSFHASLTGRNTVNSYYDMKQLNHFFDLTYSGTGSGLIAATRERLNVSAGFKGHASDKFQYDLSAGMVNYENAPLWRFFDFNGYDRLGVWYGAFQQVRADFRMLLTTDRFDMDGNLAFRMDYDVPEMCVEDPMLAGGINMRYNWNRRFFVGLSCDASMARNIVEAVAPSVPAVAGPVPGYIDLGVNAEYRLNSRWAFWAEGGNLLNQTIQKTPGYARQGVNFTAGICLRIR